MGPTALADLIERERGDRSLRQIAHAAGVSYSTLRYYWGGRWPARRMPTADILQAIANGLGVPVQLVQRAAEESVGQGEEIAPGELTAEQQIVVSAMTELTARGQRLVADIVTRLVDEVTRDSAADEPIARSEEQS